MKAEAPTSSDSAADKAVTVRRPFLKDFPAILEISNWATCHTAANFKMEPETLEHWVSLWNGQSETFPWFVAELEGAVVGFAMANSFNNRCGFAYTAEVSVYLEPNHVSSGIGTALYTRLIPTLRAQGFRTLIAAIAIPNPASERLHLRFGFRQVGLLRGVGWKFDRWHDVAYWQLALREDDAVPDRLRTVREAAALLSDGGCSAVRPPGTAIQDKVNNGQTC
jgi:phosphinothricin acetyltransferase